MSALCALVALALPAAAREGPPTGAANRTRVNASHEPAASQGRRLGVAMDKDDDMSPGAWEAYASRYSPLYQQPGTYVPGVVHMQFYWQAQWNQGTVEALDCSRVVRVGGPVADGGKLLCDDVMPKPGEPCRVVSVSMATDFKFRFETDLHRLYPHCKIESYGQKASLLGGVLPKQTPDFLTYAPISMGRDSWKLFAAGEKVNLLSVKCAGCERSVLVEPFLRSLCPDQFFVEVRSGPAMSPRQKFYEVDKMLRAFNRTHGVFYKEPRTSVGDTTVVELSWRRRGPTAAPCPAAPVGGKHAGAHRAHSGAGGDHGHGAVRIMKSGTALHHSSGPPAKPRPRAPTSSRHL